MKSNVAYYERMRKEDPDVQAILVGVDKRLGLVKDKRTLHERTEVIRTRYASQASKFSFEKEEEVDWLELETQRAKNATN